MVLLKKQLQHTADITSWIAQLYHGCEATTWPPGYHKHTNSCAHSALFSAAASSHLRTVLS